MVERVGVAFIGAGTVAHLHATAIAATPGVQLIGAYDANLAAAQALAQAYGGVAFPSLEAALGHPEVEAVAVLSPLEFHYRHAAAALHARKHVLIEKPVAQTEEELVDLQRLAEAAGVVCMPAHNYIYLPAMRQIRRCIEAGEFGAITSAWILYNLYHPPEVASKYPGVLRQIMTHHFYSVLYLLGRPVSLTALASETRPAEQRLNREDQVAILLKLVDGSLVNLFASFAADDQTSDPWTVVFKVLGTRGGGVYNWRDATILSSGAGLSWRYPAYEESFVHEWRYFVHDCLARGNAPLSTLDEARLAQRLIEAAEESIATGRTVAL